MKKTTKHQVPKQIHKKPLQNGAQLCEELETASSVTSSQKILPKLLQTGK